MATASENRGNTPTRSSPVFDWGNFCDFVERYFGHEAEEHFTLKSGPRSLQRAHIHTDVFEGIFGFYSFGQELGLLLIDGRFLQSSQMHIVDGDWIRFNFALSITLDMDIVGSETVYLESPSWRIVDHPPGEVVVETPVQDAVERWVTVICKRSVIEDITGRSSDDLPDFLRTVAAEKHEISLYRDFSIRSRLLQITSDIITTQVESPIYLPYMEARATELLCLALDELLDPIDDSNFPHIGSAEKRKLENAREYIENHYMTMPTIAEIARHACMNRNSLYYGFKALWGMSVSECIQDLRLEEAYRQLLLSDQSITEIAEHVGFRHQSNLTTAFRKKYGVTPGSLRRRNQADPQPR